MRAKFMIAWVLAFGGGSVAHASLIDVSFYNSGYPPTIQPTGAAVLGQAGDQWNWIDAGITNGSPDLIDSTGTLTGASLTFTADGGVRSLNLNTQPVPDLTNAYLFNNTGGTITVTLDGLTPSQNYLLVLYVASDDAFSGARSLTGVVNGLTSVPFSATGDAQPSFINGENVVELGVTSDASGSLTISESDGLGNSSGEVDMNGLQLQSGTVPEPASLSLLCLGGAALLGWRARGRLATSR
jgi:hypothetical protein